MKRVTIAYLLGMVCIYHVEVYGMDEKHSILGFDTLLFGGVACLCCTIFYIFKQNNKIEQLRREGVAKDNQISELETRCNKQREDIQAKTADCFRLHQQLLNKENKEKALELLFAYKKKRCARLAKQCEKKGCKIKHMRHLHRIQQKKDADQIKGLSLSLQAVKEGILQLMYKIESMGQCHSFSSKSSSSSYSSSE